MNKNEKILLTIGSAVVAVPISMGVYALFPAQAESAINTDTTANQQSVDSSVAASSSTASSSDSSNSAAVSSSIDSTVSGFADGTYAAVASYSVPHGNTNKIAVTVTIKDGVITAVSANHTTSDQESSMYTDSFDGYLKAKVVGKSIADVSFSRIGGASLTTSGFNEALTTIQNDASV